MANYGYVYEFADYPSEDVLVIAKWSSRVVKQRVDFTSAAAASAAFAATTRYIMFSANIRFAWTIGSAPVADASTDMPFAADSPYHIRVQATDKISFVASP